jgi:DNA-binding CsgD family transcriptional regulator
MIEPADLVSRIYEAAVIPEQWSGVLAATAQFAGAKDAVLIATRGTSFAGWLMSSPEFNDIVVGHSQHYPTNLRTSRLIGAQYAGFLHDRDLLTQDEIDREPVYQDFLIPRGYGSGVATAIASPSGDNIIIHAEFGHTDGPRRPDILTGLNKLRPHFARAALLSSQLGLERARAMTEALGMLALPGAVLRGAGKLYTANAAFEALMPGLIRDRRERLYLADDDADRLLAAALARVSLPGSPAAAVNSIPVAAGEGGLPYILHLLPIRGVANDVFTQATALLIVTPVDRAAVPTADVLQGLFDLTPAEARIARGIAAATSIDALATAQGVTRETVRSQLKTVLAKTGVNRQSELVSLLAGAALIS